MDGYEARRLANIKRNAELVQDLGLEDSKPEQETKSPAPSSKRRKLDPAPPTRSSRRLASATSRPATYNEDALIKQTEAVNLHTSRITTTKKGAATAGRNQSQKQIKTETTTKPTATSPAPAAKHPDLDTIRAGWTSWTPRRPRPHARRDDWRVPLRLAPGLPPQQVPRVDPTRLAGTPPEWTSGSGINVEKQLTLTEYDPAVNKYGVSCGQSIEQWEAAGWIRHEYDVRGWFQWYCRFWLGRRLDDGSGEDERQISRWKKCVGETGRWRRILLKKYVEMGVRSVVDEDDDDEERGEVSPVVHQTCHHWAYEVRQEALDRFWAEGK
ncbi:zn2+-binding protein melusin contains chord domain protein [Apiospora sp. TS-2023a]